VVAVNQSYVKHRVTHPDGREEVLEVVPSLMNDESRRIVFVVQLYQLPQPSPKAHKDIQSLKELAV
jgi:hypothetical protein